MFSFTHSTDNCVVAATRLLQLLKVPVTDGAVEQAIKEHPDYPSLLSLSDSLNHWKIATVAVKTTREKLQKLPVPFIVHLKIKGGQFIAVKKITAGKVIYLNEQGKEKRFTEEEFLKRWDDVVLLAETDETSGELSYKKARRKEWWNTMRIPAGLLILIILGIVQADKISLTFSADALYFNLLMLFSLLGMIITGLLLWHEFDDNNTLLQKVCSIGAHSSHSMSRTGCQAILNSKASKAIGNISWSEIGFIYFAGSYLYLLIAGISSLPLLVILNILALPYIIFSIYYQALVAKQWCVLCLSVQSLLLLEFLSAIFTNHLTLPTLMLRQAGIQQYNHLTIQPFILSFFLPAFIWFFAKPYLYASKEGKQFRHQLARLKNNEDVFNALLQKQEALPQSADGMGITIGNPSAENTLIKVCNPYCGPCARAHPKIEDLIHKNVNWKARIIFTATGNEKDKRTAPAAHLMAIAEQHDETKTQQALDDWYGAEKKDYTLFATKYPLNGEIALQKEKLQAMDKWCKEMKITATPTFFVKTALSNNNVSYKLPGQYGVEDLKYL